MGHQVRIPLSIPANISKTTSTTNVDIVCRRSNLTKSESESLMSVSPFAAKRRVTSSEVDLQDAPEQFLNPISSRVRLSGKLVTRHPIWWKLLGTIFSHPDVFFTLEANSL